MFTTSEIESTLPNMVFEAKRKKCKTRVYKHDRSSIDIWTLQCQYIKTIISTFCESSISFCLRRATNDCFLYVHTDHLKIIKHLFNNYNTPQYAITVDASPYSFCAEVISVRMVDDEK